MIYETLRVGLLQCTCSILGDETTRDAIVVDPGDDVPAILLILARHCLTVRQIAITHAHIDHIAGAQELKRITGALILYNQLDLPLVAMMDSQAQWLGVPTPLVEPPDEDLHDGAVLQVAAITAHVLHTPGHTPGSICLHLPAQKLLLAGDTLFAGTIGRTDLPGGQTSTLIASIQDRLLQLPDDTQVVPGHGRRTTIGEERRSNPFLT